MNLRLDDFVAAVKGGPGEMDAWLEVSDEAEVRAHILAYAKGIPAEVHIPESLLREIRMGARADEEQFIAGIRKLAAMIRGEA